MENIFDKKENCCGCSACLNICPRSAISMEADIEGFLYPKIDKEKCIDCHLCLQICPLIHSENLKNKEADNFYLMKHKDISVLKNSTSGGAFTAISDLFLAEGGYVCGVDFDDTFNVVHKITNTKEGRNRFRFSKYVQTDISAIYSEIKKLLQTDKKILFTGTPCQCAGIKSYFEKISLKEKLYICDIICHSIPSPLIWKEFRKLLEEENGGTLNEVHFRTKQLDWTRENSNKAFLFSTSEMKSPKGDDRYYKMYFELGTISRPSCSECKFTDVYRVSDITIADYWGIEKFSPKEYDPLGVSVLLVNNQKGIEILEGIKPFVHLEKRDPQETISQQKRVSEPMQFPNNRTQFWKDFTTLGLGKTLKKWTE
jgi:coenzyme F420-reducing hydrogenase beta subunit